MSLTYFHIKLRILQRVANFARNILQISDNVAASGTIKMKSEFTGKYFPDIRICFWSLNPLENFLKWKLLILM